jgi:murein hydrolase activator
MKGWIALAALLAATALTAQVAADPRARLAAARSEAAAARIRAARLESQSRAARDQAEQARIAQVAVAARIQAAEAEIAGGEARLALVQSRLRAHERRLAEQQRPIVRLVAALQTMARRPAAAVLVQPGSLDDLVHVRALLATMGPRIAEQTAGLRAEIDQTRRLRREAALALAAVREGRRQASLQQAQLARLELDQRRRSARLAGAARMEAARVASIAEKSRALDDLVRRLEREPDRAAAPALDAQPTFRFPVIGDIARGFGERLPSGARSRGVTIAARPGAIVVAPAAGRVTYAGLFRGYGAIAIIDHGDGYTSLITGLGSNQSRVGDTVAQGSPLGRAGTTGITIELRKAGEAVDFTTLVG